MFSCLACDVATGQVLARRQAIDRKRKQAEVIVVRSVALARTAIAGPLKVIDRLSARTRPIFAHGQCIYIANTAAVEVARGGMTDGMGAAPEVVRRQRQHANDAADPIVRLAMGEEGAMATVVRIKDSRTKKPAARIAMSSEAQAWPSEKVNQAAVHSATSGKAVIASSAMLRA